MIRWLRLTLPPAWLIAAFFVLYGIAEFGGLVVSLLTGTRPVPSGRPLSLGGIVILYGALVLGFYRGVYFHPLFQPMYREWLEQTPWTSRHPLPLGPVHLVLQDLLVGVVLALLTLRHPKLQFYWAPLLFVGSYIMPVAWTFRPTGQFPFDYAIWFGLPLAVRMAMTPWAAAAVLLVLYLVTLWGFRSALADFPWSLPEEFRALFDQEKLRERQRQRMLGWPFNRLQPGVKTNWLSRREGVLVSLLLGWFVYVLFALLPQDIRTEAELRVWLALSSAGIAGSLVLARLLTYCWGYVPPISLWGRIRTLRWIIPGYDRVLVAPICAALVAAVGVEACNLFDPVWVAPLTVTVCSLIALTMGPSLERWRMTGAHRIVPGLILYPGEHKKI
ncbi:MAG: hypothetical protein HY000_27565 [Planctomycetes bacterium]|nr:hypothetical protein [Planctomycetota bacterium]